MKHQPYVGVTLYAYQLIPHGVCLKHPTEPPIIPVHIRRTLDHGLSVGFSA